MKALFAVAIALSTAALAVAFVAPFPSLAPASTLETMAVTAPQPREAPPPPPPAAEAAHVVDLAPIVIVSHASKPRPRAEPALVAGANVPDVADAPELTCAAWRPLEIGSGSVRPCTTSRRRATPGSR